VKQLEVTILGQSYLLGCPDGGEALLHAAVTAVDREMSSIRDAGKVKARERIAVLAALNLAYQLADRSKATLAVPTPAATPDSRLPDLDALIGRIDAALGDDGHLL
jgi:cell division protein ZapA